jgi:Rod binding domain-containing protein
MDTVSRVTEQTPLEAASSFNLSRPRTIAQAGQQFESLLIAELLRAAHDEGGSWLGSGEDGASGSAMSVAEESLAQALASQGGFGIGDLVTKSLTAAQDNQ